MEITENEIKKKVEDYTKKQNALHELMRAQRRTINELVYEICMAYGTNGEVDLQNEEGDYDLCIIYDGGNHPEYASNVCSTVYSVKAEIFTNSINDKKVKGFTVYTEDCAEYEYDRICFEDEEAILEALIKKFDF